MFTIFILGVNCVSPCESILSVLHAICLDYDPRCEASDYFDIYDLIYDWKSVSALVIWFHLWIFIPLDYGNLNNNFLEKTVNYSPYLYILAKNLAMNFLTIFASGTWSFFRN